MNSTSHRESAMFFVNLTLPSVEPWFIPMDLIEIVILVLTIILSTIFIFIIILDKRNHTVLMLLTGNVCLTGWAGGCNYLAKNIFTIYNDLYHIASPNMLCYISGYLVYATGALHNYSYVLIAIYRYITIVHPANVFWVSPRIQLMFIGLSWFLAMIVPLPIAFTGPLIYNVNNQLCLAPLRFSFAMLYTPFPIYVIPVHLVIFIYMRLVRYVRDMSQRITTANCLARAQRDLTMVRRIVILVQILFTRGFPITLFVFLSFANIAPKYHFRIGFLFVEASMLLVMIALFFFTDPLKVTMRRIIPARFNVVRPLVT